MTVLGYMKPNDKFYLHHSSGLSGKSKQLGIRLQHIFRAPVYTDKIVLNLMETGYFWFFNMEHEI